MDKIFYNMVNEKKILVLTTGQLIIRNLIDKTSDDTFLMLRNIRIVFHFLDKDMQKL